MFRLTEKCDKPGPTPERVKIDRPWEDTVKDALKKKWPKGGWPEPDKPRKEQGD